MAPHRSAKALDQNAIVRNIWLAFLKLGVTVWVERVASTENIADDPSREAYESMEVIGASYRAPRCPRLLTELRG